MVSYLCGSVWDPQGTPVSHITITMTARHRYVLLVSLHSYSCDEDVLLCLSCSTPPPTLAIVLIEFLIVRGDPLEPYEIPTWSQRRYFSVLFLPLSPPALAFSFPLSSCYSPSLSPSVSLSFSLSVCLSVFLGSGPRDVCVRMIH